jgi:hypothetical protein
MRDPIQRTRILRKTMSFLRVLADTEAGNKGKGAR